MGTYAPDAAYPREIESGTLTEPHSRAERRSEGLEVVVLYTTVQCTIRALRVAANLAKGLASRIRLLVPQTVPYPLPLTNPPISGQFSERHFLTVVADASADVWVDLQLCRDRWQMLQSALRPRSLVVVGRARRWWPAEENRIARRLRRAGHQVVFVLSE
jgi:hypothetical protein